MKIIFTLILLLGTTLSQAQEPNEKSTLEKTGEVLETTKEKIGQALGGTPEKRAQSRYFALGNYALFDMLIPSKYGLTVGLVREPNRTWELEYLRASISAPVMIADLGGMTEERFSLIFRSYYGGSFNFNYGLSYFSFQISLGDSLLNTLSNGSYPSADLVDIQGLGFNIGVGNRWIFDRNITFGIDWVNWSQPLLVTKEDTVFLEHTTSQKERDRVSDAVDVVSYFPRLTLLKIQFGMSF